MAEHMSFEQFVKRAHGARLASIEVVQTRASLARLASGDPTAGSWITLRAREKRARDASRIGGISLAPAPRPAA